MYEFTSMLVSFFRMQIVQQSSGIWNEQGFRDPSLTKVHICISYYGDN